MPIDPRPAGCDVHMADGGMSAHQIEKQQCLKCLCPSKHLYLDLEVIASKSNLLKNDLKRLGRHLACNAPLLVFIWIFLNFLAAVLKR